MPDPMRILTCADANFFHFLPTLEGNIHRKTGSYPVIYDLGFTPQQRAKLQSDVVTFGAPEGFNEKISGGAIRTHHKPGCLLDYLATAKGGVLYVDADVLLTDTIDPAVFDDCDIAVTPRHPKELATASLLKNGRLNSGVAYFANNARTKDFLLRWQEMCDLGEHTDQMALSDLLEDADLLGGFGPVTVGDLRVLKLDPRIYNDVSCRIGRIWHFKNAGRRLHKRLKWTRTAFFERFLTKRFTNRIARLREELLYDAIK